MTTHTLKSGTMTNPVIIPNPSLIDLVRKCLPGDLGIPVMYSITGSLAFRAGRLAGMIANGLAADVRNDELHRDTIDTYNDAMSYLNVIEAAEQWFNDAGGQRQDMIKNLSALLHFRRTACDYLATLVGEDKLPVLNWGDTLRMVGEPAPIDGWKLDYEWKAYTESGDADPQMTRAEYDMLTTRELSGQRAAWAKHVGTVENIITLADHNDAIDFHQLDLQTQLSLLMSYATPERMAKFRASVMKRARTRWEADAGIRHHAAFVEHCRLASTHHRYANVGDKTTPAVKPPVETAKQIAVRIKSMKDLGVHKDLILESREAEKRAMLVNKDKQIKAKRERKAKSVPTSTPVLTDTKSLEAQPNDI